MKALYEKVDTEKDYEPAEAVALLKDTATAKFTDTAEAHIRLGIDPKYTDQQIRTTVALPKGTGQDVRVAVVARGEKVNEASEAGATLAGSEELIDEISKGMMDFDVLVATPDMMPIVGRLGKVLGPRNLMPNPKVGTVTMDVETAVKAAKGGEVQFKVEKAGVIHAGIGKASFDEAKLIENVRAFVGAVAKAKPAGSKGTYMKKVSLSSTMGPGVSVNVDSAATE